LIWLLILVAVFVAAVVFAGRAHSRYLDRLEADPERQLMLGIGFEQSSEPRRHRAWLQQTTLKLN